MGFGVGHAITGYGLYLNDEETYAFVEKYGSEYGLYDDEMIDDAAATDAIEQDMDALFLANERITDCALSDFSGNEVEGEDGLFLFCKKHGGIVASDATNLYASMDDLADELRASYGKIIRCLWMQRNASQQNTQKRHIRKAGVSSMTGIATATLYWQRERKTSMTCQ